MVKIKILFIIVTLCHFFLPNKYNDDFISPYLVDNLDAVIIYPCSRGYAYTENIVLRQVVFTNHPQYTSYHDFLSDLLNEKIVIYRSGIKMKHFDRYPYIAKQLIVKYYLKRSEENKQDFVFRRVLDDKKKLGVMKVMFDSGYFISVDDYSGTVYFSLTPHSILPPPSI